VVVLALVFAYGILKLAPETTTVQPMQRL